MAALRRVIPLVAAVTLLAVACNGPWASPHAGPDQSGYNPSETVIGVDNVATLTQKYSFQAYNAFGTAIDNGHVFVGDYEQLSVYNAGSPNRLWWGTFPTPLASAPVVAGGRVFATSRARDSSGNLVSGALEVFDATRTSPCGADFVPQPCAPLWQAPTGIDFASPTVVDGVVYVIGNLGGSEVLQAYDAAGSTGCGGSPKVCSPLWTTAPLNSVATPAVVGGRVYVSTLFGGVSVFDAAGVSGCSGIPKVCTPLFTTTSDYQSNFLAVVSGRIVRFNGTDNPLLSVYDAAGSQNCTGTPSVCSPLWTASAQGLGLFAAPAIAYGNIYLPTYSGMQVYDLAGAAGCSGTPKTCTPLRTIDLKNPAKSSPDFVTFSAVSIANGVGYIGNDAGDLIAFDTRSTDGCAGLPLRCPPLWRTNLSTSKVVTTPAIANGAVYVGTDDHVMHVLGLAA